MNKQIEFIQDCINVLKEVDPAEFNLNYEWNVERQCGCVIGHLSQTEKGSKYHLVFDGEDVYYLNNGAEYEFDVLELKQLLTELEFDSQQITDLCTILGYPQGGLYRYDKFIDCVTPEDVINKLNLFADRNGL